MQELTLGGNAIIQDLAPFDYTILHLPLLFYFRLQIELKMENILLMNEEFQLEKNQEEEQNALHGFVYNKTFKVIAKEASADNAKITVEYNENNEMMVFLIHIQL